jgi:hypothetical protein
MFKSQSILLLLFLLAGTTEASIKCWINRDGVRECGNVVPPEYAQQQHEVRDRHGLTTNIQQRAKSVEELRAEEAAAAAERQRKEEDERRARQQAAYDRVLISTFLNEEEILAARDRQVMIIDGTIEMTRLAIEKHHQQLDDYLQRAAALERSGRSVPDDLLNDMVSIERQVNDKQEFIQTKQEEREATRARYAADLARFRELKGLRH